MTEPADNDFGFAIVGCGMIARFHARALAEVPGARVAALVSRSLDSAGKLSAELGLDCPVYTDLSAALARPDVRAVIVTTPSGAHLEPAVAAAGAGKHVVVEKPLEITAERCDRIIEACDRNGVTLCTIFPSRFGDANRALKVAMDGGRFGRLTLAETTCKWWRSQEYYDQGGWKGTQALDGGGALMNQAIHNVDLLLWLMGPVVRVVGFTATLAHERIEVEDTAVACLCFANGALGVIQATTSVYPGLPKTIAIHGDRGTAVVEQDDVLRWDFTPEAAEDRAVKERDTLGHGQETMPQRATPLGHGQETMPQRAPPLGHGQETMPQCAPQLGHGLETMPQRAETMPQCAPPLGHGQETMPQRAGGASDPAAISHQGHARQLADFVRAVRTGGKPLVDGREGRRAVEVIEAIYRSARSGHVGRYAGSHAIG